MWLYVLGALAVALASQKQNIEDKVQEMSDSWTRFDNLFYKYGDQYGVDWKWLKAICLNESDLGENESVARGLDTPTDIEGSKSSDGLSWGIMQVTLRTAKGYDPTATEVKLNDPEYSISIAARLFSDNMKRFPSTEPRFLEWAVKAYNEGAGAALAERKGHPINPKFQADVQEYWARFQRNLQRVEENQS